MPPQQLPVMHNINMNNNQSPMMNNQRPMSQGPPPAQPQPQAPTQARQQPPFNQGNMANRPNNTGTPMLPMLTDDMKVRLRQLIEEVSRNNVALKDVNNILSQQDKNIVRATMIKISQQYANVDSIISYFFILTRNVEGTKRLIQMKYMTKNIMDNLQQGNFLATPDLAEKLRAQYLKYFDYVKEQFNQRRQQMQNRQPPPPQNQSIPQQQFQKPPANQQPMPPQQLVPQNQGQQFPNQMPPYGSQNQQFMNLGQANQWPNIAPPGNVPNRNMTSPMINNNSSPIMAQQTYPPPNRSNSVNAGKGQKKGSTSGVSGGAGGGGAGRRKSNKTASTPSGGAVSTPAALANAIKTPNSIPTPQVPQSQSNKNTPSEQSPNYQSKQQANAKLNENALLDIFSISDTGDQELSKRRELSNKDPEKFFFASLSNLLQLDDSIHLKSLPTPSPSLNGGGTKSRATSSSSHTSFNNGTIRSPLSPNNEWTATIKPQAIVSSFKQVEAIKDVAGPDILEMCSLVGEQQEMNIKREREDDDDGDIDILFNDKKFKPDDSGFNLFHDENIGFDDWKKFIIANSE